MNPITDDFFFLEPLGVGAQANVDIYQSLPKNGIRTGMKIRAVKTYKRQFLNPNISEPEVNI